MDVSSRKSRHFVEVMTFSQYSEKQTHSINHAKQFLNPSAFPPLEVESRNIDLTEFFSQPRPIYPVRNNAPPLCTPGMAGYHSK